MRHGIAEDRAEFAKKNLEDSLRPLTLKGRRRVQQVSMRLLSWMDGIELIVSSPFTRARQTAEIAAQVFMDTKVVEAVELIPSTPPQAFLRWLKSQGAETKKIMAVGHEPHLTGLASFLLAGREDSMLELKKGGILNLRIDNVKTVGPSTAELLWLVQPKQIID
jgi:phosphohistidine phosphatase